MGVPASATAQWPACPHRAMWFGIGGNGVSAAPLTNCTQSVGGCKDAQKDDVQVKSVKGQELGLGKYWKLPLVVVKLSTG